MMRSFLNYWAQTFAFALIDLIPTRKMDGDNAKSMLDQSLQQAVAAYS